MIMSKGVVQEGDVVTCVMQSTSLPNKSSLVESPEKAFISAQPIIASARLQTRTIGLVLLGLIFSLSAWLRLYALGEVPDGLYIDEVATSVEARVLGQTARDLAGNFLPLFPEAWFSKFWGYDNMIYQPVYVYSKIPFELLLPTSAASARLPSVLWAMAGIASTTAMLWAALPYTQTQVQWTAALTVAALMAISPWHHHFSRLAFEVISMTTLITLSITLLFKSAAATTKQPDASLKRRSLDQPQTLFIGCAVLGVSVYTYHTARLFAPFLFIWFCVSFKVFSKCRLSQLICCLGVLFVSLFPLITSLFSSEKGIEWAKRNIVFTTNFAVLKEHSDGLIWLKKMCAQWQPCRSLASAILEDQHLAGVYLVGYHYLTYMSPSFLFWNKDLNSRHSLSNSGVLLLSELPLLLLGIAWIVGKSWPKEHFTQQTAEERHTAQLCRFLLFWLLTWPLPACICVQTPHAIRAFTGVPILEVTCALGITFTYHWWKNTRTSNASHSQSKSTFSCEGKSTISHWKYSNLLLMLAVVVSSTCLTLDAAAYYYRYFSTYANESRLAFNREVSLQTFLDLRDENYLNKSHVFVTEDVDSSYCYILYIEDVDFTKLDFLRPHRCVNSDLLLLGTPYEVVFKFSASTYIMGEEDLLLISERGFLECDSHRDRLRLLRVWHGMHGALETTCTQCYGGRHPHENQIQTA